MASTVTLAGPLVLPAGSWATALITVPLASGVLGVNVQLPLPSAVAWPIGLPPPSVRITVAAERLAERFFQFELDDIERKVPFANDKGEFQVSLTHGSFPVPGGQFLSNPLEEQATLLLLSRRRKSLALC